MSDAQRYTAALSDFFDWLASEQADAERFGAAEYAAGMKGASRRLNELLVVHGVIEPLPNTQPHRN